MEKSTENTMFSTTKTHGWNWDKGVWEDSLVVRDYLEVM